MAIVQTVNQTDFICAFHEAGRGTQFTPDALRMIFDYLEEYSDSTGEPVELDVVGICCDWSELTWQDCAMSYGIDLDHCIDDDERIGDVLEYMIKHTTATELSNGNILFINF
jgi:hypothetical protein